MLECAGGKAVLEGVGVGKGRPWIRPGAVVALRLARHGHLQAPMPSVLTRRRPWGVAGSGSRRRRRRICRGERSQRRCAVPGGFDSRPRGWV